MSSRNTPVTCRRIHPALLPFVEQCLSNDNLNTQGGVLEVIRPRASSLDFENGEECDRFTLGIPYCGTQIEWEVIFDRNHPALPPDIIVSSEDERMAFNPDIDQLLSFSSWNIKNHKCLSTLMEELLLEYKHHHRTVLSQFERLDFELTTLLQKEEYSQTNVHCLPSSDKSLEPMVRFYIPLAVDFSAIPAYLTKDNPGPDTAALLVTFYPPNASRVLPSLFLSPRVERMLGGTRSLRLPPWGGGNGSHLMDYVPAIHKLLAEKVEAIVQSYISRKECVAAFLSVYGCSVLEYDTEGFKRLAFLFEHQGFTFITILELSDEFPQEQPILTLLSIYHRLQGKPCQSVVNDYPYSPRWDSNQMAERLRSYLIQVAPQFRELSKNQGECL